MIGEARKQSAAGDMRSALPEGWSRVRLPEIADITMGQSPPGSTYNSHGEGLPFFQGKADFGERYPTPKVWCTQPKKIANPGDVLISVRAPVGPTNVADRKCIIGRGLVALSPLDGVPSEFLLFALRLQEPQISIGGTGSTFTAISKKDIEGIEISLPPLDEQKRIVAKVEELLARVNTVRERLEKAKEILKRFRQSVLAAAFTGRLSGDNSDGLPKSADSHQLASDLLEARKMWSLEVSEKTRLGKATNPKIQYSEVQPDDISLLQEIPSYWRWTSLSRCTDVTDGTHDSPKYHDTGIPLITSKNLKPAGINFKNVKLISHEDHDGISKRSLVSDGDVLFAMIGTIGNPTIVDGGHPFSIKNVALFRTFGNLQLAKYLKFWLNSPFVQKYFQETSKGSSQPFAPLNVLRRFPIPLPTKSEFDQIISRVEALFMLADIIENRVETAKAWAEKLPQAILAKAFSGELVPTESELARQEGRSYEPASALLDKIRTLWLGVKP